MNKTISIELKNGVYTSFIKDYPNKDVYGQGETILESLGSLIFLNPELFELSIGLEDMT